ncbi:hypothetical protein K1Y38_24460 [Serratia marcescens]|uniref:hypothetical protein n=1 Tax=Serratia marcescens TaxID=615 RepID=UPI002238BEC0|nr:hypothetical protein [Serratia marcescens]EMB6256247.1 hypothetical protein [Serratia marcescens]MCW6015915.1 hypothetical protein [Serratia marcescens]MCW6023162.1 hypothetical protein [Serratia marcescens]
MQHNALVGRLITQPVFVVKDDTRFCRFTVAELRKRSGNQTKIEFTAFDAVASHIADKCLVGDTVSINFTITNAVYESDGVNHHGYRFQATLVEFVAAGKQRREQESQRIGQGR